VLLFGYALCHCPFPGCTRAKETSLFVWQNQAASLATTRPRAYRRAVAPCVRSIVVTCYWSRVVTGTPHGSSLHQAASPRTTTPRKSHHAPSSRRQRASSSLGWPKIGPPVGCTAPTAASDLACTPEAALLTLLHSPRTVVLAPPRWKASLTTSLCDLCIACQWRLALRWQSSHPSPLPPEVALSPDMALQLARRQAGGAGAGLRRCPHELQRVSSAPPSGASYGEGRRQFGASGPA
jgi:hypothetical protein